eukprot:UN4248
MAVRFGGCHCWWLMLLRSMSSVGTNSLARAGSSGPAAQSPSESTDTLRCCGSAHDRRTPAGSNGEGASGTICGLTATVQSLFLRVIGQGATQASSFSFMASHADVCASRCFADVAFGVFTRPGGNHSNSAGHKRVHDRTFVHSGGASERRLCSAMHLQHLFANSNIYSRVTSIQPRPLHMW